jgi:hypothetical protein
MLRKIIAPYVMIGGIGGGFALILLFIGALLVGSNPLFSDFLFWDVILLSFTVFMAALNYHIKNSFRGYKIAQTLLLNALSVIVAIMVYVTFMSLALPSLSDTVNDYKQVSIGEVEKNREAFISRGLKAGEIDTYIEDIRKKEPLQISTDTFQKLIFASPFIVFVAFVLILLMHFGMILMRDRAAKKME